MKASGLWKFFQRGAPRHGMARLVGQKSHHNEEIDGQSKDLRSDITGDGGGWFIGLAVKLLRVYHQYRKLILAANTRTRRD
jgi:hypothetical protein